MSFRQFFLCLFSQIAIRQVFVKNEVNERLVKISYDPENETHFGQVSVEFFEDLKAIIVQAVVKTDSNKLLLDQTINFCKWMDNRKQSYLINFFKKYYEKYNPLLLKCPIKKGFYIAAGPRERITNAESFLPSFLPLKGNITVLKIIKAKVEKMVQHVIRATNIYELF